MNPLHTVLLQCFLAVLVRTRPVLDRSSEAELSQMVQQSKTLVEKILRDLPVVHGATIHTVGLTFNSTSQPTNLQIMATSLGIPPAPVLKQLSERFTLEQCVSRLSVGVQLHHDLLGDLEGKVTGLTDLKADLRDLLSQINKMQEQGRLGSVERYETTDLASRINGDYQLQVATHLTLIQLRSFCHDMVRSLRNLATTYRPGA
ncbi:uncharacterized protein LOC130120092 [Lampris incognitus]|uniref:uncharacterized protein LOC130120092 n=1 Tax=Lampris incognitus TaxID=2546036 RepID=UPI0024B5C934|nr:uncharacterized protein LOC130120092 [Lampris incognitus]